MQLTLQRYRIQLGILLPQLLLGRLSDVSRCQDSLVGRLGNPVLLDHFAALALSGSCGASSAPPAVMPHETTARALVVTLLRVRFSVSQCAAKVVDAGQPRTE